MIIYIIAFVSFFISLFSLKYAIPILSRDFLDKPNFRSSHSFPVPTGGGITFVLISIVSSCFINFWIPLISFPLALIGFLDDKKGIPATFRYLIQISTVIILVFKSQLMKNILILGLNNQIEVFLVILLIFAGTAVINFVNFMDGLDGFLAVNIIIIFCMAIYSGNLVLIPITSALMGFLIWNWSPAKVFMGDVGSTFLGSIYLAITLNTESFKGSFSLVIIAIPLLGDAFICVLRRFINGENIFRPHKLHLYQRLNQAGISHSNVCFIYAFLTLITCFYVLKFDLNNLPLYFLFITMSYICMDRYIAIPFKSCRD